jgi:hypothetical protein
MTDATRLVADVVELARSGPHAVEALEAKLAVKLEQQPPVPRLDVFKGEPSEDSLWSKIEARYSQAKPLVFVVLTPRVALVEADLDLSPLGAIKNMNIEPRIPPAGVFGHSYSVGGGSRSAGMARRGRSPRRADRPPR